MSLIIVCFKLAICFGIINVWLIRFNKQTSYRGSSAKNLKDEFTAYGYPSWFFYLIGGLKLIFAVILFCGFWFNYCEAIGSLGITCLMIGAVISHIKVKDQFVKFLPASMMLMMSVVVFLKSSILI
tara:strand:+ start:71 stop:448 length:378 start_codon:yes stop_codon:yes gene_type:complete